MINVVVIGMIFDHMHRSVYACISPRTNLAAFNEIARKLEYSPMSFECRDAAGVPIYHTNVMMSIGDRFAVIALESITDSSVREKIKESVRLHGIRTIVDITLEQMSSFAGNVLQLATTSANDRFSRRSVIAMSTTARNAFTEDQRETLENVGGKILAFDVPTIEMEGGSVRCMIAEVFAPPLWHDEL